jgi:hypothetical protein
MGFGVFIHRSDSIYDDSPAERYQFPPQYLRRVEACIGDWIVYYEPRKIEETRGYFAMARVEQVIPDPKAPGMHFALIEPGSYLDFANPVPFSGDDGVVERGVLNSEGRISGARNQQSVRFRKATSGGSSIWVCGKTPLCCRELVRQFRCPACMKIRSLLRLSRHGSASATCPLA